jgi:predicted ATPase/two-component sensor histidine kinase
MMLDRDSFRFLRSDDRLVLFRSSVLGHPGTVLVLTPQADSDAAAARRINHEFGLAERLSPTWAAVPLDCIDLDGRPALVLEDGGGDPLSPAANGPLPLARFLRIAVSAAAALRQMHGSGLIHRDIRPDHLLANAAGEVRVTGFGLASDLVSARQQLVAPALIESTFAYMAPEQTGRMNRSIDARSDLYALGVTLYEMLSGWLPFQAAGPVEWIHCHVARPPRPLPASIASRAPAVAAIVMKLLSKAAEDRYQTAGGLEADLRRCLSAEEPIAAFPLGQTDVPNRLLVPERLYGRERELARLFAGLDEVVQHGHPRMLLVSGPAGIGKSALVHELRAAMLPVRGILATGKCEQYRRTTSYAAIGEAFRRVTIRLLSGSTETRAKWRARLESALGRNARLLINLVPELAQLMGEQPPIEPLPPANERLRFQRVVRAFLSALAQAEHPLVLFLDDLQWLDGESMALVRALAEDCPPHLLLIGAYRDAEVPPGHPVAEALMAIRQAGVAVEDLALAPLAPTELRQFVADALHSTPAAVRPLSDVIAAKTGGNPFFVSQFMTSLMEQEALRFDHAVPGWRWQLDRIQARGVTDNIVDLMTERLVRLPEAQRELLATLAYLGGTMPAERLALAHGAADEVVRETLETAAAAGLVTRMGDRYGFLHDRIQEAAYALTPVAKRAARHLGIARHLAKALPAEGDDGAVLEVVSQYNRATSLIDDAMEREQVAALNLRAGRRARATTAFEAALSHFETGLALLSGRDIGRLSFDLEFHAAECLFLKGGQAAAERRFEKLLNVAAGVVERAAVAAQLITLHTARDRSDEAVKTCLAFLREAGIDYSPHPGADAPWEEYQALLAVIGQRPVGDLAALPACASAEATAVMDVLAAALPPAFFSDKNLVCLLLCRMARISLREGICDASALGYAYLGMMMGPFFGDYRAGFAFGQLGHDLVLRRIAPRYEARVQMTFAYHVAPWTQPMAQSLPLLRRAFDIAAEVGDLTYCGFSACTLITSLMATGTPLSAVQAEAETKLRLVRQIRFGLIADIITSQLGLVRRLRGLPSDLEDPAFEARLQAEPGLAIAACWHWIRRLQAAVYDGDVPAALAALAKAEPLLWTSDGHFEIAEYHFHAALALTAAEEREAPSEPSAALQHHQRQLHIWAEHGPASFTARMALVDGAIAALRGEDLSAMRQFEAALRAAREHELVQVEALTGEWAGRFFRTRDLPALAAGYVRGAREAYLRWGATAKVQQLEQFHRELTRGEPLPAAASMPTDAALDLASLVRTSQAVSGEVGLSRLMQTLMTTVLEHAGASRGLLILPRSGALRLAAEASVRPQDIRVTLPDGVLAEDAAPLSILGQVLQTHEPVLIGDCRQPHAFSEDAYFTAHSTRSALCLPLLRQAKLTGLLFVENELAPHVFTAARIAVLRLLASQAAISLENALLEEKDALLKEMHHRVKNNLQLISSLLNLQASRIEDPHIASLFADSRDRVRSMALVHENLYRTGDYARVSMRRQLGSLCAQLQRAHRLPGRDVSLRTELADLHLDIDKAVSCGLIVNELVSNAFKHGFDGRMSGQVEVLLEQPRPGQGRLTVRDDGIGFGAAGMPPLEHASSLGLQLVSDLVHQLRGETEISTVMETRFTVTFPLSPQPG